MAANYRQLERRVKGFDNHRRIEILFLLQAKPELSVDEICQRVHVGYKTGAVHVAKLAAAGLILKRNEGQTVRHKLSDRGQAVLTFLPRLE